MKKGLKKALTLATAMATMSISVCALAETTATYSAADGATYGTVALPNVDNALGLPTAGQLTVVVVPTAFGAASTDENYDETLSATTAANIHYINQEAAGENFNAIINAMGLKDVLATPGDYEVRIGGENLETYMTFGISVPSTGTEVTFIFADTNGNAAIDTLDATAILLNMIGGPAKIGTSEFSIGEAVGDIVFGDTNGSAAIDTLDATAILLNMIGGPAKIGTSKYSIGETVTITIPNN